MKKVIYSEHINIKTDTKNYWELQEQGEAEFMEFGVNYEEFENGSGNFSTAIIKLNDGTIKNIPCEHVKFI